MEGTGTRILRMRRFTEAAFQRAEPLDHSMTQKKPEPSGYVKIAIENGHL